MSADSRAIVDGAAGGDVFYVAAANVSMRCLTIRHGETGIYADQGITVSNVRIISSDGNGIYIGSGDDFKIQNAEIVGTSSTGIYVDSGFNGVISDTIVRGSDGDCYYLDYVDGLEFFGNQGMGCCTRRDQSLGDRFHDRSVREIRPLLGVLGNVLRCHRQIGTYQRQIFTAAGKTKVCVDVSLGIDVLCSLPAGPRL